MSDLSNDDQPTLDGVWDVLFVGSDTYIRVEIDYVVVSAEGQHLYIVEKDGSLVNWSTIIKMKRPET